MDTENKVRRLAYSLAQKKLRARPYPIGGENAPLPSRFDIEECIDEAREMIARGRPEDNQEMKIDLSALREPSLTAEQFARIQRDLGLTDNELADNLGLSPRNGGTRVRRIKRDMAGYECTGPMAVAMVAFAQGYRPAWYRGGSDQKIAK